MIGAYRVLYNTITTRIVSYAKYMITNNCQMNALCIDYWNIIAPFTEQNDYLSLMLLSKYHHDNINREVDEDFLKRPMFRMVYKITCSFRLNLAYVKNTLKELYCLHPYITQEDIGELRLTVLHCNKSNKIYNVNHIKDTLRKLHCRDNCGITQQGIKDLQLRKINYSSNDNITDVSHMKSTLKYVNILECIIL